MQTKDNGNTSPYSNMRPVTKMRKGFTVAELAPIGIAFVVIAFVISMGGEILDSLQDQQTSGTYAYNVTEKGLESMEEFGDWLPTLALVIVAAVIIGVLVYYLGSNTKA